MKQHRDLYTTLVDLTKAFDTVCRDELWITMEMFGCQSIFIAIVRQFLDGKTARVLDVGERIKAFSVTNGVKQGRVLVPKPFSMIFPAILTNAFKNHSRTEGKNFNSRYFKIGEIECSPRHSLR